MPRLAAAILAFALLATACTSSTSVKGSRPASSASLTSQPAAATLQAQLLTTADLPSGWTVDDSTDPASLAAPPCVENAIAALNTTTKARMRFVKGVELPLLEQQIGRYDSQTQAGEKYTAGAAAIDACGQFSFDFGGVAVTGSIARLAFAKVGDKSTAWRITLTAVGQAASADAILVAKGIELELIVFAQLADADSATFTSLVNEAEAKMPS